MIQLICEGKTLDNISQPALEWFFEVVSKGKEGPFTCETINGTTKNIILNLSDATRQKALF